MNAALIATAISLLLSMDAFYFVYLLHSYLQMAQGNDYDSSDIQDIIAVLVLVFIIAIFVSVNFYCYKTLNSQNLRQK